MVIIQYLLLWLKKHGYTFQNITTPLNKNYGCRKDYCSMPSNLAVPTPSNRGSSQSASISMTRCWARVLANWPAKAVACTKVRVPVHHKLLERQQNILKLSKELH